MDQIEFADGFDRPDTIAFGLGAGQLAVVMVGALAAYSLVRSPLPSGDRGSGRGGARGRRGAALGWLRIAGRPALDWAVFAGLFSMRPRRGTVRWELAAASAADGAAPREAEAPRASILELFGKPAPRASDPDTPPPTRGQTSRSAAAAAAIRIARGVMRPTSRATAPAASPSSPCAAAPDAARSPPSSPACSRRATSENTPAPKVALVDLDLRSPSVAVRLGRARADAPRLRARRRPRTARVIDFMVTPRVGRACPARPAARGEPGVAGHAGAAPRGAPRARHGGVRPRRARRLARS